VKRIVFVFCVFVGLNAFAQDRIILETGDTMNVVVANRDKKNVTYVEYDDPEFKTSSMSTERIAKIIFENGKVIDFKKSKFPGAYVGVNLGTAMPISDFAQDNYNDDRSGFATGNKFAIGVAGRIPIWKFIGIGSSINIGSFGVNEASYFDQVNTNQGATGSVSTFSSGTLAGYRYATFTVGPDLAFKLGTRLKLFVPLELSFISMNNKDGDNITIVDDTDKILSTLVRKTKSQGMGVAFGISLEYMLTPHIGLGIQAKAYSHVVDTEVSETDTDKNIKFDYTWTQNVMYTNFGITARYHFR